MREAMDSCGEIVARIYTLDRNEFGDNMHREIEKNFRRCIVARIVLGFISA